MLAGGMLGSLARRNDPEHRQTPGRIGASYLLAKYRQRICLTTTLVRSSVQLRLRCRVTRPRLKATMASQSDQRSGSLEPSGGPPPPPATSTETEAVRASTGTAYLDKMQIMYWFFSSPLLPFLAGHFRNPGQNHQIRGRPLDSARAEARFPA